MSAGILRTSKEGGDRDSLGGGVGSGGRRRSSHGIEPSSPAPSVDRLSVTFAMEDVVVVQEGN